MLYAPLMDRYLLESGDVMLLESGDAYLLETPPTEPQWPADGHCVVVGPDRRTVTVYPTLGNWRDG